MKREIIWSARARKDYLELMGYLIEKWGLPSARKVNAHLLTILDQIAHRPEIFQRSLKHKDIRKCVLSKQTSLYYRVRKNQIELITLFDNRQNPNRKNL
ncbi:MAG: type II toxin-antitoxin system RelE/ParE family toxin [Cryomorphaceae bacterium]|nr:MAG: type II toxin-antitoxin system RelE/ParE family toxin [Cryomorphaceae bacterium]